MSTAPDPPLQRSASSIPPQNHQENLSSARVFTHPGTEAAVTNRVPQLMVIAQFQREIMLERQHEAVSLKNSGGNVELVRQLTGISANRSAGGPDDTS